MLMPTLKHSIYLFGEYTVSTRNYLIVCYIVVLVGGASSREDPQHWYICSHRLWEDNPDRTHPVLHWETGGDAWGGIHCLIYKVIFWFFMCSTRSLILYQHCASKRPWVLFVFFMSYHVFLCPTTFFMTYNVFCHILYVLQLNLC